MNENTVLDEFGQLLIASVRDPGISKLESFMRGELKSHSAQTMWESVKDFTPQQREVLRKIVIWSIDRTMHDFLWMFEQSENFSIGTSPSSGGSVKLAEVSDGLGGELYSEDGWISRFSQFPEGFD